MRPEGRSWVLHVRVNGQERCRPSGFFRCAIVGLVLNEAWLCDSRTRCAWRLGLRFFHVNSPRGVDPKSIQVLMLIQIFNWVIDDLAKVAWLLRGWRNTGTNFADYLCWRPMNRWCMWLTHSHQLIQGKFECLLRVYSEICIPEFTGFLPRRTTRRQHNFGVVWRRRSPNWREILKLLSLNKM